MESLSEHKQSRVVLLNDAMKGITEVNNLEMTNF